MGQKVSGQLDKRLSSFEYLKNCIVLGAAWANQELQFRMRLSVALLSEECKQCSRTYHELEKVLRQIRLSREMMGKKKKHLYSFQFKKMQLFFLHFYSKLHVS
jgi:hypothetical protein